MVETITRNLIPVKLHIKEQPQAFDRFHAPWTPTQIIMDAEGVERHRIEGFLTKGDFLAQLEIGLGRLELEHKNLAEAERHFREVVERYPGSSGAAEATYWAGVSRYKKDHSAETLRRTAEELKSRFPESEWAKKASIWLA